MITFGAVALTIAFYGGYAGYYLYDSYAEPTRLLPMLFACWVGGQMFLVIRLLDLPHTALLTGLAIAGMIIGAVIGYRVARTARLRRIRRVRTRTYYHL
jgi:hypothetical protein